LFSDYTKHINIMWAECRNMNVASGVYDTNYAQTLHHKDAWWSGRLTPLVIKVGVRWK